MLEKSIYDIGGLYELRGFLWLQYCSYYTNVQDVQINSMSVALYTVRWQS